VQTTPPLGPGQLTADLLGVRLDGGPMILVERQPTDREDPEILLGQDEHGGPRAVGLDQPGRLPGLRLAAFDPCVQCDQGVPRRRVLQPEARGVDVLPLRQPYGQPLGREPVRQRLSPGHRKYRHHTILERL
jgi:hypothetical protein